MVGVFLGRFAAEDPEAYETNMDELFEFFKQGKIKPAANQSFKMDDFVSAFNIFKKSGWVTKLASSFIYNILSTYTGEKCGFINFEELNPTNKKLLGVNKVDYRPHNWL